MVDCLAVQQSCFNNFRDILGAYTLVKNILRLDRDQGAVLTEATAAADFYFNFVFQPALFQFFSKGFDDLAGAQARYNRCRRRR